ncbi:zinc-binding dehydrogenase [Microlunatus ginsengisoli]|uniref:Alcohol dehydrogenase catalytic domain-containing protein n=1 Tax=Microlunatus ginsengisoli TaxID=363863 RepID=A0ABP6ZBY4_9ACTN
MAESVRAAVLTAPGRYEVQEFPRPTLADGALLMQVELSGICGTDKHTYAGETKQYAGTPAETDTPFPIIQGHENVGIVTEITPRAAERIEFYGRRLKVGDRITHCPDIVCGRCYTCKHVSGWVWCDNSECYGNSLTSADPPHLLGGWAEQMYLRPDTFVYKVPDGLSPRIAVLAELMACTASLDKLKEFSSYAFEGFNSGDTVVVIGSGPLGLLHVAKADLMGAGQIIATDLSSYRLDWAKRCGADEVLDVTATSAEERIDRVRALTGGRGADVVLHMANTPRSFVEGIEMLKRGGMMLEMGNFADTGETSINVHRHVCSKNIRLVGLTNHPSTGYGPALRLLERYADRYPFEEMVTHTYGLDAAEQAMRTSMSPESMKVAIAP